MPTRRVPLGPSYDEETYWDKKFKVDQEAFEWLGSGQILLDAFQQSSIIDQASKETRILQLGAGTSNLSIKVAKHYQEEKQSDPKSLTSILNLDFSQEALLIGEKQADLFGLQGMRYLRLDLRKWKELASCQALVEYPLSFIFDKSTSDAISTNADVEIASLEQQGVCPLLTLSTVDNDTALIDPLDLVALHLAALSKPGCVWAALSYSSSRFDILKQSNCQSRHYWSLMQQKSIQAPSGSDNPSAPPVFYWFYLLQRR